MGLDNGDSSEQFAILTPRFILVPTTTAISFNSYRALYAELHANVDFCQMGFGHHFPARSWNDEETRDWMRTRDIERSWQKRNLGDFAVGLRGPSTFEPGNHSAQNDEFTILKGNDYARVAGPNNVHLAASEWVGYSGLRDATTTSMPPREPGDPVLPSWNEMVELRYGVSPKFWGQGIVQEASKAVMRWSIEERGIKRFVAETERENTRSAKVLQKLGFTLSDTNYWKEPSELEWVLAAK
ncbi:Acyl-CoA N-acyltransferase [Penicillium vulpinum]|uniref:N-acetyltransferase domain-containing protein n=1 Tax=Penicillium vulpinum TaxID=29845 RepID=A0A1V6REL1_9EURO|nr:Acyl-CoA N-acyltransferase [Penicillium vulpinum]KAJ5964993.1 Acyl-CoA N-acyltransferase [Penicillium vulpinum]OQD99711.1 hypothetical protein PENVUL_c062G04088 [Penicillium vulpinum]